LILDRYAKAELANQRAPLLVLQALILKGYRAKLAINEISIPEENNFLPENIL
jgi:hypothetical protein